MTSPEGLQARARALVCEIMGERPHPPGCPYNCIQFRLTNAFVALAEGERAAEADEWIDRANRYFEGLPQDWKPFEARYSPDAVIADVVMHEIWKSKCREDAEVRSRSTSAPAAPPDDVCTDPDCPSEAKCGKPKFRVVARVEPERGEP